MPIVFPLINSEWILSGLFEWPESINTAWIKDLNMDQVRYWWKLLRQGTPTLNSDLAFAGRHMSLGSRVNNPFVPLEGWTQKRKNTQPWQHEKFNEILVVCFFFPFMVLDPRVLETTKPGFLNPTEPCGGVYLQAQSGWCSHACTTEGRDWVIRVEGESQETVALRTSKHGFQYFETVGIAQRQ